MSRQFQIAIRQIKDQAQQANPLQYLIDENAKQRDIQNNIETVQNSSMQGLREANNAIPDYQPPLIDTIKNTVQSGAQSLLSGAEWYGTHPSSLVSDIGQGLSSAMNQIETSPLPDSTLNMEKSLASLHIPLLSDSSQKTVDYLQSQKDYFKANPINTVPGMIGEQIPQIPLWIAGEGAVSGLASKFLPKLITEKVAPMIPGIITGGLKDAATYGAAVAPAESFINGDNLQQFIDREKQLPSVLAGGIAFRGAGKAIDAGLNTANPLRKIAPDIQQAELATDNNIQSLNNPLQDIKNAYQAPTQSEFKATLSPRQNGAYSFTTGEQRAMDEYNQGILTAQNYIGHNDVLAGYPPGTTIEQAYADVKANTGVDIPALADNLLKAQNAKVSLAPEELRMGRVAGVVPRLRPLDQPQTWTNESQIQARMGQFSPLGVPVQAPRIELPNPVGQNFVAPNVSQQQKIEFQNVGVTPNFISPQLNKATPNLTLPQLNKATPNLGALPGKMEPLGNGQKARSFPISLENSQFVNPELKAAIAPNIAPEAPGAYNPITLKAVDQQAKSLVDSDLRKAVEFVLNTKEPSALHTATGIRVIERLQNEGDFGQAVNVSMSLADHLTKQGQAISAARIVGSLSPEGILNFASRQIQKINTSKFHLGKDIQISPETAENLKKLAEVAQNATDEGVKLEASQNLQAALNDLNPSGIGRKIASAQTIGQLANPKTQVRNIVGNEMFYRLERINKYIATPIDWARSALTGADRTVTFHTAGQGGYWDGFLKGAKAGWKGVNPNGLSTQYDLGRSPAFDRNGNAGEKVMSFMERSLGAVMKGFDNAAYNRAYNQTVGELATLKAINSGTNNKVTIEAFAKDINDNVMNIADQYGKYVTFQDNNVISNMLSGVKRGLNMPTGGEFGLGDLIIKYPKTPGALIARGLDYSPAGFFRSAYIIAKSKGILKGTPDPREATMALSRAITGTVGLTGLGYFLADNGIISGSVASDKDLAEIQRQAGQGPYRVNLSALTRWARSGFNSSTAKPQQGDMIINYDWAQPIAMALSMGANVNQSIKDKSGVAGAASNTLGTLASGLEGALNTVAEQPVLQGVTRLFQGYNLGSNFTNTLKSLPPSFVPTLLNQVRQATDNTTRVTHNPNPLVESLNMAKAKIPGVAGSLPPAFDSLGGKREVYQNGGNSPFNVFLNPAFTSKYSVSPEAKKVLDVYNQTGSTTQLPRVASTSITVSGQKMDLTTEEYSRYQQLLGEATRKGLSTISGDSTDAQAKAMVGVLDKANADAKTTILRERGIHFQRSGNTLRLPKK